MLGLVLALTGLQVPSGDPPTFARDIAPLVFERCAPCHRPGEAAPFPLLTYRDVAKRSKQIVQVTGGRFMPPWLPAEDGNAFEGDRSLSPEEIETLRRWHEAGSPEGDPAGLPPAPIFPEGWQLGEPDLVVTMPESYTVPAEGRDVYRNFVIPKPVRAGRYVSALEFRPDNRAVLHHAVLFVDGSGYARGEDRQDPTPGYEAMGLGVLRPPNGQFVSWTPGKGAIEYDPGIAWSLDPDLDIVLQLHLRPTGRPESIRVSVGLYFSDEPPTQHPLAIRLWSRDIDIAAGDAAYVLEEEYTLPVDVSVYGVYPHAHYLGRDIRGWAVLPDGTERSLIHIPSWDFNWQEEYFYADPIALPKGTVVHARYVFDNSSNNPFNPNQPPERVTYGFQSSDEMAELQLQVLTKEMDRPLLWHDFVQLSLSVDQVYAERTLATHPNNRALHDEVYKYCMRRGDTQSAIAKTRELLERYPGDLAAMLRLGQALDADGDHLAAVECLEQVVAAFEESPNRRMGKAMFQLGRALQGLGREEEAQRRFEWILERDPGNFLANTAMAELFAEKGEWAKARARFEAALATNPEHLRALWGLARVEVEVGKMNSAKARCQKALEIAADEAGAHWVLGSIAVREGQMDEALQRFELALRFEPDDARFRDAHARASADGGEPGR